MRPIFQTFAYYTFLKTATEINKRCDTMLEIYAIKQSEILDDDTFGHLLTYVSEEKRERINKYRIKSAAQQCLISDVLIRSVIHQKLRIDNTDIHFGKNKYGKPYLMGNEDFHFNVSHSNEWVVCAISDAPVGIDVEKIKPTDYNISERFFSEEEHNYIICKEGQQKLDSFYDLWTLKESYIKAIGKGLHMSLKDFSIVIFNGLIYLKDQIGCQFHNFKQFSVDMGYKLSVCLENEIENENLSIQKFPAFQEKILSMSSFQPMYQ